ncbi:MAG: hypothetical protein GIW97_08905 [Candidatus Eremiobacteraeota bacterium]|nr:hypothetical protein [Candidatus Eremiobacteraeota bacterium]
MVHALTAALTLWGASAQLPSSVPNARKYAVSVSAKPGTRVFLRASGLPANWVGSFCTQRLCAPNQVSIVLPASGTLRTEFQIIPDDRAKSLVLPVVVRVEDSNHVVNLRRISRPADSVNHL